LAKLETISKRRLPRSPEAVPSGCQPLRREDRSPEGITDLQRGHDLRRVRWLERLMRLLPRSRRCPRRTRRPRAFARLIESCGGPWSKPNGPGAVGGRERTAVAHWAAGDSVPTGQNSMDPVALRRVGKREAKELLARRVKEMVSRRRRTRKAPEETAQELEGRRGRWASAG